MVEGGGGGGGPGCSVMVRARIRLHRTRHGGDDDDGGEVKDAARVGQRPVPHAVPVREQGAWREGGETLCNVALWSASEARMLLPPCCCPPHLNGAVDMAVGILAPMSASNDTA